MKTGRKSRMMTFAALLAGVLPAALSAQTEKLSQADLSANKARIPALAAAAKNADLKAHLLKMANAPLKEASNAARVASDVQGKAPSSLVYYTVPAMSEMQYLPDVYPVNGRADTPVRIFAAQGEYEPGSFVVYPFRDLGKVTFSVGDMKTKDGKVFPKEDLDLKVVKVWYQNGNAWFSYFGDTELKLVPELLLNDEELIKADTEKVQNYARLTDPRTKAVSYQWITPPLEMERIDSEAWIDKPSFNPMKPGFADASTFQPVSLPEGQFKQFFLTVHTTDKTAPGTYTGVITISADNNQTLGTVPVSIRVLPFRLPEPKTYFDVNRDFLTTMMQEHGITAIMKMNGQNRELAEKQLLKVYENDMRHHMNIHPLAYHLFGGDDIGMTEYEIMKKAGMRTDLIIGGFLAPYGYGEYEGNQFAAAQHAAASREWADKVFGPKTDIYICHGDEPGPGSLMSWREAFKPYQEKGFKFVIAGGAPVLYKDGYFYDFVTMAQDPADRETTRMWNEIGHAIVGCYANQHIASENPAYNRRQNGLAAYLANYSALWNYISELGPYNDRSTTYRPMTYSYGTSEGVIDTLQWEAYREGVDDIRYATLLKTLALEAEKSKNTDIVFAGRQALQFFAEMNPYEVDPASARLEMIRRILNLQSMLAKSL